MKGFLECRHILVATLQREAIDVYGRCSDLFRGESTIRHTNVKDQAEKTIYPTTNEKRATATAR